MEKAEWACRVWGKNYSRLLKSRFVKRVEKYIRLRNRKISFAFAERGDSWALMVELIGEG
jgi:hypothetical protein